MREAVREQFRVAWTEFSPDAGLQEHAEKLARQKYSQNGYNQKR
jgi:hypothetical protein